ECQKAGRNLRPETPIATLTAIDPSSETGCNATVRFEPPMRTLAPAPKTDTDIAGGADVFARKRASRQADGWCEDCPAENATCADPDVDTDGIEGALIGLRRQASTRGKPALHRLMTSYDEADARIELAGEHSGLCPRSLSGCRRQRNRVQERRNQSGCGE